MIQKNNDSATILAIDSATGPCSVALLRANGKTHYAEERVSSMQSARLLPMIEEILAEAGLSYSALTSIAVTVGPGSFTGIRIALSAARAIGFAANIPTLGFSVLDVLAYGAYVQNTGHPMLSLLNAGKGEMVAQKYNANFEQIDEPTLGTLDAILATIHSPTLVSGFEVVETETIKHSAITFPRADVLAALAYSHPEKACEPVPFYIRPPDAKISAKP